ncbi:MAG: DEAD/DEAH box helicase [Chloroflexota bacterium]|nr:DEAD/DEAH box helicase [Chloroflexota bacterium]
MTGASSQAFEQLDRSVQRWIWRQQWNELREIQERAVAPILNGRNVLISSATASGKTEAAFLPICSALAHEAAESLGVIYVAPLKALINDQQRRLEPLFECIDAVVTPWHGDVASSVKRRFVERPRGALLITPESLEALFVTRGTAIPRLVEALRYIVVDELHAFIGTERGRQLQSLMHRLDIAAKRRVPRVALSATLGDLDLASDFLLPRRGGNVERITSSALGREVKMQVRGYRITRPQMSESEAAAAERAGTPVELEQTLTGDDLEISRHLYETLHGGTHLIFANRRLEVERFADLLRRRAERTNLPNEFWPHHGSLSREIREEAEERLHGTRPATVIATTTLELGMDIGAVDSIAQIGEPGSVASLKQRLGRSGREEGAPSVIRVYVQEREVGENTPPQDQLRSSLVQTVAMVRLLVRRWVESPPPAALHLSTLVQQVLSLTAQHGGFRAADAYQALCSSGPFNAVDESTFAQLLRDLAGHDLLTQTHDGMLVLDLAGERLVNHYDFYAAFTSPDEWRLLANGRALGTLPVTFPLARDLFLIFAGRRWRVVEVHEERREVDLEPARGGIPPRFGGPGAVIHDRVRDEMRRVYEDNDIPLFLDASGRELLAEGRRAFRRLGLRDRPFLHHGRHTLLFPWVGDRVMNTLALQLRARQVEIAIEGSAILARDMTSLDLQAHVTALAEAGPPDTGTLATFVENKRMEKHHVFLSDELLSADYASSQLDSEGAWRTAMGLSTSRVAK